MTNAREAAVVVTGMGVVSPIASGCAGFWEAVLAGRSGVRAVRRFDTSGFAATVGCEVPEGQPLIGGDCDPPVGRATRLAATAGLEAIRAAQLDEPDLATTAFCLGTTMGEASWIEGWSREAVSSGSVPAEQLLRSGPDEVAMQTAGLLGLGGRVVAVAGACAAGNYAIGLGLDLIRLGRADRVLVGGSDAFSRIAFTGFGRLGALAAETCRPFSADRDGIVLGEGAAMLVLESAAAAKRRGAAILAEVRGHGLSCDAHHIVSPSPDGRGIQRAMEAALRDARLAPEAVDYVCAHGTGTSANDGAEVRAMRAVFGDSPPPMSSIKALIGHALGAASALEAVACVLALQHQVLPPTWHFSGPDPDAAWDVVPNAPRPARIAVAMNNAAAFGGNNSSVVFGRAPEGRIA